mmetsp:Transcript_20577/g.69636  ORF Transcript_20577/g.69636 Transcript_20577/m.69636 type:complete len:220 (-) Transcript_20577:269-928(-)
MASRKVLVIRPALSWRKPEEGTGRKTPEMVSVSPAAHWRVMSPYRWTVIARGTWPCGTWSGSSWILTSWNFSNLEPRVWRWSVMPFQLVCGMKVVPWTSWYTSVPSCSHVYVATFICGFTSVTRVTMPLSVRSEPMCFALTCRSGTDLSLTRGRTKTWYRRVSSAGTLLLGSTPPTASLAAAAAARVRSSIRTSKTSRSAAAAVGAGSTLSMAHAMISL